MFYRSVTPNHISQRYFCSIQFQTIKNLKKKKTDNTILSKSPNANKAVSMMSSRGPLKIDEQFGGSNIANGNDKLNEIELITENVHGKKTSFSREIRF